MPLSSSPTYAEVKAAYAANVGYDLDGDVAACREFIKACRLLLSPQFGVKRASHGGRGAEEVELDQTLVEKQLNAALAWFAANSASSQAASVIHPDFNGFRD